MQKHTKITLWSIGAVFGALILIVIAALYLFNVNSFKPKIEEAATRALGMDVQIGGDLHLSLGPGLQLRLEDVSLRNHGSELGSAKSAILGIEIAPFFKKKLHVQSVLLNGVKLQLVRDEHQQFNFEHSDKPKGLPRTLDLSRLSISNAQIIYHDQKTEKDIEASGCRLDADYLRLTGKTGSDLMKNVEVAANLACDRVQYKKIVATDLKLSIRGDKGNYQLRNVLMQLLKGQGKGQVTADFTKELPQWHIEYQLTKFRIEELLAPLNQNQSVTGAMDFTADISAIGKKFQDLRPSLDGEASLRGRDLTLVGRDLDRELARYDSTRNFNLVDLGAVFFAGPLGLAVTKGYDYARLFQDKGSRSEIKLLLSEWRVKKGVALAKDVAMTTNEHRLALHGGLDLVHRTFQNVSVALVDAQGCTVIRQKIHGPFHKPVVDKPNVIQALTAPALKLLKKTEEVFTGKKCEHFYQGSVPPSAEVQHKNDWIPRLYP